MYIQWILLLCFGLHVLFLSLQSLWNIRFIIVTTVDNNWSSFVLNSKILERNSDCVWDKNRDADEMVRTQKGLLLESPGIEDKVSWASETVSMLEMRNSASRLGAELHSASGLRAYLQSQDPECVWRSFILIYKTQRLDSPPPPKCETLGKCSHR